MQKFGQMAAAFNSWKTINDITINFNDSRGYFWRIGNPAKEFWQPEFEIQVPNAKHIEISSFRAMFEENGELLGIPVSRNLGNFEGIRLYKTTEYNKSFLIENLLTAYNGIILSSDISYTITDTFTNDVFNLPIIIKPETLSMSSKFDGIDVISSKISGLIYGYGFRTQMRNTNRINGESIMGTIDYRNGNIQLIRSNDSNDKLIYEYEKFVEEYVKLPPGTVIGGEDSGLTVSASEDSGSDSGSGAIAPIAPTERLYNLNLNLNYTVFGNPVSKVWEFIL